MIIHNKLHVDHIVPVGDKVLVRLVNCYFRRYDIIFYYIVCSWTAPRDEQKSIPCKIVRQISITNSLSNAAAFRIPVFQVLSERFGNNVNFLARLEVFI